VVEDDAAGADAGAGIGGEDASGGFKEEEGLRGGTRGELGYVLAGGDELAMCSKERWASTRVGLGGVVNKEAEKAAYA
jgi:hypothetical protein